jgi:hypothetical protein
MGKTQMESEVGTQNLDETKVGLETTLVSSIFLAFLHAFSNANQSHSVVHVTKQPSFEFH